MNCGARPVVAADAQEPPEHVRQVAPEHAAVRVELVDDDVAKVLEEPDPLRVVRQDPRVEHVGVRQHHVGAGPDGAPGVLGRVPVVGVDAQLRQGARQLLELRQLVLRERLRGEEVERPRRRLASGEPGGPAGCSRASCRTRSASPRPRGRPCRGDRAPGPGGCTAPRSRAPAAHPRAGDRSSSGIGTVCAGRAGNRRSAVTAAPGFGDEAVDQLGEVDARFPGPRHLGIILGVAREHCQCSGDRG